jgi:hypothetical protein
MISASRNSCTEDVRILAIIVAELKLRDVQRHIFGAHLVERVDHAALEDRPETFNRVGVNRADHVVLAALARPRRIWRRLFKQLPPAAAFARRFGARFARPRDVGAWIVGGVDERDHRLGFRLVRVWA